MFGIPDFGAFCLAVIVFLALPGPGTFALLSATGQGGLRAGLAASVGLIAGDQVLLWLAVAGVAAVLAAYPAVFDAIRWAGALYLGWIGLRLLLARDGSAAPIRLAPRHYARQALLITVLNPKAIVFYMAFFPQFIDPATQPGWTTYATLAGSIAVIECLWCLGLCTGAGALAGMLARRRAVGRWLERGVGLCLVAFGLRLLRA
jgi:threonine/homoserine/homoserine lactone efflux protein